MTVLITGLGVLSCTGAGTDAFWAGMRAARSAPRRAADPHADMEHPLMYSVPDADVPADPAECDGLPLGDASRYALAAAAEALADAGLGAGPDATLDAVADPSRVAVVVGTGMGDSGLHERWHLDGAPPGTRWAPVFSPAAVIGARFGASGANTSVSNACAASGFGLSIAADLIRSGEADVVIAGGVEAYSRVALGCFNRLGAIDPLRCRPFDRERAGTVFGEGAAILVLESAEHAEARGAAKRYAALAGAGWSCDAYHSTAPEPGGGQIARAMRQALDDAGIKPADVGAVIPHGTGTQLNDVVESGVLTEVLGPEGPPLYSLKALVGHTGGAAGALAALAGALIIANRQIPPSVPRGEPDPRCPVLLPDAPVPLEGSSVLVNAYAFGGNNVSLVLQEAGS
ncbi:beta-ketoacyl synthase N-terminal-like domain-containing protein [Streptosporangium pseudovulgare]|uniref:3-oxoacyl-ACP synthase n=1 Tax=Streptosporangium pseudovulgare TaxID=35765 RepID=A0ABQ2R262_9ACTN|nr:beta-ketoacyl synthase N-terminal-like domain-containing protein [Streptosporangium pseudovulgare]GGQ06438.1 3-oxoacyl-ACP synthase [Streptosporangium pseudovulgare]